LTRSNFQYVHFSAKYITRSTTIDQPNPIINLGNKKKIKRKKQTKTASCVCFATFTTLSTGKKKGMYRVFHPPTLTENPTSTVLGAASALRNAGLTCKLKKNKAGWWYTYPSEKY